MLVLNRFFLFGFFLSRGNLGFFLDGFVLDRFILRFIGGLFDRLIFVPFVGNDVLFLSLRLGLAVHKNSTVPGIMIPVDVKHSVPVFPDGLVLIWPVLHVIISSVEQLFVVVGRAGLVPKEGLRVRGGPLVPVGREGVSDGPQPVGLTVVRLLAVQVPAGLVDPVSFAVVAGQGPQHGVPGALRVVVVPDHPEDPRVVGLLPDVGDDAAEGCALVHYEGTVGRVGVGQGALGPARLVQVDRREVLEVVRELEEVPPRKQVRQKEHPVLARCEVFGQGAVPGHFLEGRVEGHVVGVAVLVDVDNLHAVVVLHVVGGQLGPGTGLVPRGNGAGVPRVVLHHEAQVEVRIVRVRDAHDSVLVGVDGHQEEVRGFGGPLHVDLVENLLVLVVVHRQVVGPEGQVVLDDGPVFGGQDGLLVGRVGVVLAQNDVDVHFLAGDGVEGVHGQVSALDVVPRVPEALLVPVDLPGTPLPVFGQQDHLREDRRTRLRVDLLGGGDGHLGEVGRVEAVFVGGLDQGRVGDPGVGVHFEGDLGLLGDQPVAQEGVVLVQDPGPQPRFGERVDAAAAVLVLDDQGDREQPLAVARQVGPHHARLGALVRVGDPLAVELEPAALKEGGVRVLPVLHGVLVQLVGLDRLVLEVGVGVGVGPVDADLGLAQLLVDFVLRPLQEVEVVVRVQVVEEVHALVGAQVTLQAVHPGVLGQNGQPPVLVLVPVQLEGLAGRVGVAEGGRGRRRRRNRFGHGSELFAERGLRVGVDRLLGGAVAEDEVQGQGQSDEGHRAEQGQEEDVRGLGLGVSEHEEVHEGQHPQEKHHEPDQQEHHEVLPVEEPGGLSVAFLV